MTAAIKNMKPYKTDILCMPWYWGGQDEKEHNANRATCTVTIHDFKWKSAEDCRPAPDPALAGIKALEQKLGIKISDQVPLE